MSTQASKRGSPLPSELLLERPARSLQGVLVSVSIGVHLLIGVVIGVREVRKVRAATAIEVANVPKKPEPARAPAEPRKPEPSRPLNRPAPAPARDPVAEAKPQGEQFDGLPDFGLALSGSGDGPGLAVPARRPVQQAPVAQAPVVRRAARASAKTDVAECEEPLSKPRPKSVYKPSATEEARAAGVEGKVRVEVTVDESGNVVSARLLNGLGYGLDEASLAAARRAEFFPASRCGKPVSATLVISMRFSAG